MFDNVYVPKAERNSFEPRAPHGLFIGLKSKRQQRELTRAELLIRYLDTLFNKYICLTGKLCANSNIY